jgi:predicted NAD/FAD-dependent oxidoreductase
MVSTIHPVIIIGAGVAGLMAQSVLRRNGIPSLILEKSRGLGGRCATRRGEDFIADHGPQYFNARVLDSDFLSHFNQETFKKIRVSHSGSKHSRLVHPKGMSKVARSILTDPEVLTEEHVSLITLIQIKLDQTCYQIECKSGKRFHAQNLILTPPVPQSLSLLETILPRTSEREHLQALQEIIYDPCIALILELAQGITLGDNGIWKNCSPFISGIYNQPEKGLETKVNTLVVHASPELSRKVWNLESAEAEKVILAEATQCLSTQSIKLNVQKIHLHRWKYAEPQTVYPKPYAFLGSAGHECALAGDGFGRSSIGGALASGEAVALAMIQQGI